MQNVGFSQSLKGAVLTVPAMAQEARRHCTRAAFNMLARAHGLRSNLCVN